MIKQRLEQYVRYAAPLAKVLKSLRHQAESIQCPALDEWCRRHLGLSGDEQRDWVRRAWWGFAAGEIVRPYLYRPKLRPQALALVDPPDLRELRAAHSAGGVIVAGTHLGPPHVAVNTLVEQKLPLVIWTAHDHLPAWVRGIAGVEFVDPAIDRSTLARTAMHLRSGGVMFGAADAARGKSTLWMPTGFEWNLEMATGVPALARLLKLPVFRYVTAWNGDDRIRVHCRRMSLPDPALPSAEWDRQWLRDYWAESEAMFRTSPENAQLLRFVDQGALWEAVGL